MIWVSITMCLQYQIGKKARKGTILFKWVQWSNRAIRVKSGEIFTKKEKNIYNRERISDLQRNEVHSLHNTVDD